VLVYEVNKLTTKTSFGNHSSVVLMSRRIVVTAPVVTMGIVNTVKVVFTI